MTVAIVPIVQAHAESFHACLDAVARERLYLAMVEAPPLEQVRGFVADSVAGDVAQLVALDGLTVVGWCDVLPRWQHAIRHCGTLGMGVLAPYRGRGIGRRLLQACIAKARAGGITRIVLEARADNSRAIALYERMGFVHEARTRKALRFDGVYHDGIQMALIG